MKSQLIVFSVLIASVASAERSIYHQDWIDFNKDGTKNIYEDTSQQVARRVDDLLGRMTVDEKIGQLSQVEMMADSPTQYVVNLRQGGIGSFLGNCTLVETPMLRNRLQHFAVEESRLGIPLIFGHDVIHGFRTTFPIPLAQACAWEPGLFERTETIAAREAAAAGVDWVFAPMVDLARDPRWGRIAEGFGEDPWLGEQDAAASVRGFQGTNAADPNRVAACLKHYVGYGAAEGGRDYNTTEISEFTLRNFYLPQFKAGVDAGALTIMAAFNELSGFPASGNRHTLTEILRDQWKFSGFVVSDWGSVTELADQGVSANDAESARLALTAGVDMEMVSTSYADTLKSQIAQGTVSEKVVDEAVRRILTVKFEKGLFEHPFTGEANYKKAYLLTDALALAREAAAKSCVLLKDENSALPISRTAKKIALIGPLANDAGDMLGCWYSRGHAKDAATLAAGIRTKLALDEQLVVVDGCDLTGKIEKRLDGTVVASEDASKNNADGIAEAVAAAKSATVVILALGEPVGWSGENSSCSVLGLPGQQTELFDAVVATGKPVIVVLFNGRPLALPHVNEKAAAILDAWFPGVQGGNGIADILFGDVDPGGRLTASFPYDVGQIPIHYNHFNTGRPGLGQYLDGPNWPLYPFGFGLTYTTFSYGKVSLSAADLTMNGTLTAHVQVKNTGARAGAEVVQLYLRALAASAGPRPVRELKGFQKILLQPGEMRDVSFSLSAKDLGYYDTQGKWLVDAGKFQLWITKDSASGEPAAFTLEK